MRYVVKDKYKAAFKALVDNRILDSAASFESNSETHKKVMDLDIEHWFELQITHVKYSLPIVGEDYHMITTISLQDESIKTPYGIFSKKQLEYIINHFGNFIEIKSSGYKEPEKHIVKVKTISIDCKEIKIEYLKNLLKVF